MNSQSTADDTAQGAPTFPICAPPVMAELQESEYRDLVEHARSLILRMDTGGRVVFANPAALQFLGQQPEAVLGREALEVCSLQDRIVRRQIGAFLAGVSSGQAEPLQFEACHPQADGQLRWVSWTIQVLSNGSETPTGLLCIGIEITARQRAESALQLSEERYRLLFERSPLGVFHYDTDLHITECNDRFVSILQSQRDRLIGLDLTTLRDQRVLPCLREAMAGREGLFEGRYEVTTSPATPWLVMRTAPLFGPDGEVSGGVGIIEDTTARRLAEEEVRRRQQEITTLLDSLPGYAFSKDRDGVYVTANMQFCRAIGRTRDRVIGMTDHDLFPPALADKYMADDRYVLERCEALEVEEQMLDVDRLVVVATRKEPLLDETGRATGLIGLAFDLTDRKRTEENQRLASIGQLAAGVAHEFNNLLASMMMKAELAIFRDEPRQFLELAQLVLRSSQRGAAICQNLIAFAGPRALSLEVTTLTAPIEEALSACQPQLTACGIEVRKYFEDANAPIAGDRHQLEQVFANLIMNACHAMPTGGVLSIRTRREESPLGRVAIATVRDTGPGIKPEHLPHVFDPFFTTKGLLGRSEIPGTGLGLSVSHGVVKGHGGHIALTSPAGEGVCAEVSLPVLVEERANSPLDMGRQAGIAAAAQRPLKVLLAEDEDQVRELVTHILAESGCIVDATANTQDALVALAAMPYDLVIADWLMPGGGGREVAAVAKALEVPPPVVVITGRVEPDVNEELLSAGVVKRLLKPFHVAELMMVVNEIRAELEA